MFSKILGSAKNLVGTVVSVITENVGKFVVNAGKEVVKVGKKMADWYQEYLERENKKTRDETKKRVMQEMYNNLQPQYELVAEILFEAINNTVEITHLLPIQRLSQIFCQFWLGQLSSGVWYFEYRGRYRKGFGMTAEDIQRILQSELTRLCGIYGHPPLSVHIAFDAAAVVKIRVAYTYDLRAAQKIVI